MAVILCITKLGLWPQAFFTSILPDVSTPKARLFKAETLISRHDQINQQSLQVTRLKAALDLGETPDKTALVMQMVGKMAQSHSLNIVEFKPGTGKYEAGLWILPTQIRVQGTVSQIMNLVTDLRHQAPMIRIPQMTILAADHNAVEANLSLETIFSNGDPSQSRSSARQKTVFLSQSQKKKYFQWIEDRINNTSSPNIFRWDRLSQAFGSGSEVGNALNSVVVNPVPDQPQLLGIVNLNNHSQALISLGTDSWYFKPGQIQAGITMLAIGAHQVTVKYKGNIIQLYLSQDFPVTPLR